MKNWIGVLTAFSAATLLNLSMAGAATAETGNERTWNMMLTGSDLNICSSMRSDACDGTDWIQANDMRTARLFQLTDVRRREALRGSIWPESRNEVREELNTALSEMVDYFARGVVPEYRFVDRFRSRAYFELLMRLSEAEFERVLDNLEMPRLEGLNEVVNLERSSVNSAAMVREFVRMAQQVNATDESPRVLIVTAGHRDSFAAVDRFKGAFDQAGADVEWLPVDAAMITARAENRCESLENYRRSVTGTYDRDRVNPKRHEKQVEFCKSDEAWQELLAGAHGVFFAGGEANRLRSAFVHNSEATPLLAAMQQRFERGSLVIGASGKAASAMVGANMITNGTSREALRSGAQARNAPPIGCDLDDTCPRGLGPDSLTYEPLGGLGFFNYGIIDTDVSQRGYQARMMRLAGDTDSSLAVGIDRDTALLVNTLNNEFEVMGSDGVFVAEGTQAIGNMLAATFHYLRSGSGGEIVNRRIEQVIFAPQEAYRPESVTNRFLSDTGVYDSMSAMCAERGATELLQDEFKLVMQVNDSSLLERSPGRCQVYSGVIGIETVDL